MITLSLSKMGMMLKMDKLKKILKGLPTFSQWPKMGNLKKLTKIVFKNGMMPKMNTLKVKLRSRTK